MSFLNLLGYLILDAIRSTRLREFPRAQIYLIEILDAVRSLGLKEFPEAVVILR